MATESATLRIALCAGGVSKQAPESRSRSQVEVGDNIDVSLTHGSSRRNGSRHLAVLSGVSTSYNHWLTRCQTSDGSDVLVNTDSNGGVRVYDTATYAAQTVIDLTGGTYLSSGTPSRHAIAVVGDDILLSNPTVAMASTRSPAVSSTGQRDTYDSLEPFTGTPGGVYRARENGAGRGAGLYRYMPGTGTFATAQFAAYVTGTALGDTINFCHANQNPRGFRIFYSRFLCNSTVAVYATAASAGGTIGLIASGLVLTGYVFQPGDYIYYSGGGGGTAGAYPISGYSGGILYLDGVITGAAAGNVEIRGIGRMVDVLENFHTSPVDTMDQAAVRFTAALREGGLRNACVHWDWTNLTLYTGQFTITAGDGGPLSGFNASYTAFGPSAAMLAVGANDDTAGGNTAFTAGPTVTAGTGAFESFTTPPHDRWVPVAAPDQADAVLDATTMPVRLRKVDVSGYDDTAIDLGAWHYFRLGDNTGNATAKDSCGHAIGTYTNAPTRGVTGLVTGDSDTATTFDGTDDYVTASTWWAIGNRAAITVEMLVQTTDAVATEKCLLHMRQSSDLYVTMNKTQANRLTIYAGGGEYYCDVTNFNDGNTKHLAVVCTASSIAVYVNGATQTMTVTSAVTGNPGIGAEQGAYTITMGKRIDTVVPMYFAGTLDEVAVYPFAFTASLASFRYGQVSVAGTGLWVIDAVPWGSRLSGDSLSNPLPNLIKNASPALSLASWQSRFAIGGERFVLMSGINDPYRLFVASVDLIADSDPIERPCGSTKTSRVLHLAPYRKIMVAFTDQGEQYEVGFTGDALTPAGSSVDLSTAYDTLDTPPVLLGDRLYFAASDGSGTQIIEYTIDELSVAGSGERVGQHVEGYLTASDIILSGSPNDGVLTATGRNSASRWRYYTAYVGNERRSQAWTKAEASADEVLAACQVDGDLYTIVRRGSDYALEAVQTVYEPAGAWTYQPRMDGRVAATGVYSAPTTTWAVPAGVTAAGITHAVKSDGTTVAVTVAGSNVTASGNYAGSYVLGRAFTHTLTLSRPFLRDGNDAPYTSIGLRWRHITARLKDTMYAALSVVLGARAAAVKIRTATTPSASTFEAWVPGDADRTSVSFTAADPRPFSVGAIDIEFDAIPERQ